MIELGKYAGAVIGAYGLSLALLAIGTLPSRLRWPGAAARRKRRHRRP